MRRFWLFMLLVGFVGVTSACLLACGRQCTGTASCTRACYSWDYPPGDPNGDHYCSDIIAHPDAGKVCKDAVSGTCNNNKQVACGKFGYKTCAKTGPPDCSGISHDDTWYMAGCE